MQQPYSYSVQNGSEAGPSRIYRKVARPFVSADHRPETNDGIYRVVLITSGSVASIRAPNIVGELCKTGDIAVQVVATKASTSFYTQHNVDEAVREAIGLSQDVQNGSMNGDRGDGTGEVGVRVWTDDDEWGVWKKVGDPILHIELRRWADLVVIAPCSADILAKIAGGLCDNLATSLLRALPPTTPVILCPAMNTHMYQHKFTAKHLKIAQEELEYFILGPQGTGKLACGDEGPGKMTDWREIVSVIKDFGAMHRLQASQLAAMAEQASNMNLNQASEPDTGLLDPRPTTPPTPGRAAVQRSLAQRSNIDHLNNVAMPSGGMGRQWEPWPKDPAATNPSLEDWRIAAQNGNLWARKWWIG